VSGRSTASRVLLAGLAYFAIAFAAGMALGAPRLLYLVPRLGTRAAELIELPVMLGLCWLAARWSARRFGVPAGAGPRLAMGGLAAALLLAFEFTLVLRLRGLTFADYLAERDPVSGPAYYAAVALMALLPWLVGRRGLHAE
jgi:hypothetical protein